MEGIELFKKQIWLLEKNIHVMPVYESGAWHYIIYTIPSDEDVKIYKNYVYDIDNVSYLIDSHMVNDDWYINDYKSFPEALKEGINAAMELVDGIQAINDDGI